MIADITLHKWFLSFDWSNLWYKMEKWEEEKRTLTELVEMLCVFHPHAGVFVLDSFSLVEHTLFGGFCRFLFLRPCVSRHVIGCFNTDDNMAGFSLFVCSAGHFNWNWSVNWWGLLSGSLFKQVAWDQPVQVNAEQLTDSWGWGAGIPSRRFLISWV